MSGSNEGSGVLGGVLAFCLLVVLAGGFVMYQRSRAAYEASMAALEQAKLEELQAIQTAKAAQAQAEQAKAEKIQAELLQAAQLQPDDNAESSIREKLAAQQNDWNQGDLDAFMKVYWNSEQLTFSSSGKTTRGWQATLDGYKSRYPTEEKRGKLTFGDLEFHPLDQAVMLVLGTWHLERGAESVGGNFSLVWKKFGDQWLIVHDHTSAKQSGPKTE